MHRSVGTSSLPMKKKNEYTHKLKSDFNVMLQTQCDFDCAAFHLSLTLKNK